jgi:hypothetical protein
VLISRYGSVEPESELGLAKLLDQIP